MFTEIIVTGRTGANACRSRTTKDYLQADEAWWTRTANERQVWCGQLEYDRSAETFGVSIHITIWPANERPRSGAPAGIAKLLVREP